MEYTTLGNTDIKVSKVCLGCMSFGKAGTLHDWTLDEKQTEEMVKHALDLGINFFDTSNNYSKGTSEEYLGKAFKNLGVKREDVIIASKVYFNEGRLSKEAIFREIDGTLKRLGTDYLDLYIIHRFDYDTPIEETMEALHELVKCGKVRAIGASAMYGYQFHNMQIVARDNQWTPFSTMENHYNIGGLGSAVADLMAENGIGKKLIKIGLNGYAHGASKMYLMTKYGIDAMNLVKSVEELIGKDLGIKEDDLDNQRFVDFLEV